MGGGGGRVKVVDEGEWMWSKHYGNGIKKPIKIALKREGIRMSKTERVKLIKVYYVYVWKYNNTTHFVINIC
jgi:hypothetical protein